MISAGSEGVSGPRVRTGRAERALSDGAGRSSGNLGGNLPQTTSQRRHFDAFSAPMLRVVSAGLWKEVARLSGRHSPRFAAIAYVSSDARIRFGDGDVLVCDATDEAIKSRQTSARVLHAAFRRKARIYSSRGLHAKALVLGRVSVVGSANLSESSASHLNEAAIITDDASVASSLRGMIEALAENAESVDDMFLRRIATLPLAPRPRGGKAARPVKVTQPRGWLVGLKPIPAGQHSDEDAVVEKERERASNLLEYSDSEASYIRMRGGALKRGAQRGDAVIQVWRASQNAQRAVVYPPVPIVHRTDDGPIARIYVEDYADTEDLGIPLGRFRRIWAQASGGALSAKWPNREVSLDVLDRIRALWPR